MLKTMIQLAKMQFNQYNIYKSNFYLFTLNRIVEIIVYVFVWQAIYNQTGNAGGFTISQMITYYILATAFSSIATWGINETMSYSIRNGQINKELLNLSILFWNEFRRVGICNNSRNRYIYIMCNLLGISITS